MAEEAMRAMHQQFTTALDSLTRQNADLQAELAQSRQQAANELAALRQEIRAPLRGSQVTGVGVDKRLLGMLGEFSGAQGRMARLEYCVQGLRWRSGATSAETGGGPCGGGHVNPECHDAGGRRSAASAQLCWMMLMIPQHRVPTEKYGPKMRTRLQDQLQQRKQILDTLQIRLSVQNNQIAQLRTTGSTVEHSEEADNDAADSHSMYHLVQRELQGL